MARPELHETLTALVGAVPMGAASDTSITVAEVDLDVPMEVSLVRQGSGLIILAAPGHTRFVSGVLPVVHRTRLVMVTDSPPSGPSLGPLCDTPPEGWSP
jgi:hypothetical protein